LDEKTKHGVTFGEKKIERGIFCQNLGTYGKNLTESWRDKI
jgi:hypothetical protein